MKILLYIVRRLLFVVPQVIGISLITFVIVRLLSRYVSENVDSIMEFARGEDASSPRLGAGPFSVS